MTTYQCGSCGNPPAAGVTPLLDPRYADGYCIGCRKRRTFVAAKPLDGPGQARRTDPATSHAAAAKVRTGSAKMALLRAHAEFPDGLTDEEAAMAAHLALTSEYATRCSELMRAGLLADTPRTRSGNAGMQRQVRVLTAEGRKVANG